MLGKPEAETNLVICHLGAGSSMCAVQVSVCSPTFSVHTGVQHTNRNQPSSAPPAASLPSFSDRLATHLSLCQQPPPPSSTCTCSGWPQRRHDYGLDSAGGPDDGHTLR
jgi:hypothetical protein